MLWMSVSAALLIGLALGLGAASLLRRQQATAAKELAERLFREHHAEQKAQLAAVVETIEASVGNLTSNLLSKSTEEVVKLAKSKLESERAAGAKELDAKKSLIDRQLQVLSAELAGIANLIKGLEGHKTEEVGELATQLRTAREQTAALMENTNTLAAFIATERRRGEDVVRDNDELFRVLAGASPIPMALCRAADTTILFGNERLGALFGCATETMVRRKLAEYVQTLAQRQALLAALRKQGQVQNYEVSCTNADQKPFSARVSIQPLLFDGTPALLWGFVDVTVQKRAEEELRHSQALLAATLESTSDGMCVVDGDRKIVCCNQKFIEMWRIPDSVMATRNDNHLLTFALDQVKDPAKFLSKVRTLYGQPDAESYDVVEFKDGRLFERYSQPHRSGGAVLGRVWSFRDITERKWGEEALEKALKESEEQLRQSQKLEAIGQLAGGVAHDFNNLLTIIGGYSQFLLKSLTPQDAAFHDVEEIRKATKRATALTQQLLAFSRKQSRQPTALDLNDVVTDLTRMLRRLLGEHIHLVTQQAPDPVVVQEDPTQIEQIIVNLAVNARDAMPRGGTLTLETAYVDLDQAFSRRHPGTKPGRYVRLSVKDTGTGMDAKTLARCFEPFFTTKPSGQGTGLGLATVYGIVKQSEGAIDIQSKVGQGTTMTIYLRRWDTQAGATTTVADAGCIPRGTETVLVVEDDAVVRTLIRKVIEQHGYTVLDAVSGPAALALAEQEPGAIHLLVTDVVMPEMSGPDLVTQLTAVRPGLKALYLTGYAEVATANRTPAGRDTLLLQKPFTPEELALKVREALDYTGTRA
ncbi:MAG: response regulator [Nitrospirae bacterium]|nr:MAG: response regulator [Nitrospirota bacterium]